MLKSVNNSYSREDCKAKKEALNANASVNNTVLAVPKTFANTCATRHLQSLIDYYSILVEIRKTNCTARLVVGFYSIILMLDYVYNVLQIKCIKWFWCLGINCMPRQKIRHRITSELLT
jgi:hypothetical protein